MNSPLKVLVDPAFRRIDEILAEEDRKKLLSDFDTFWCKDEPLPLSEAATILPNVDAVVCSDWRYGDLLHTASNLKAIITVSGGFPQDLDYEYCHQQHIHVLSAAPAFGPQVAEMALGLAIASGREIVNADRDFRAGTEEYLHRSNKDSFMLFDQPIGLIGFGGLANNLRSLLAPFRPRLQVFDPWVSNRAISKSGCQPVSLPRLMAENRFIFVLAIPSIENAGMINREMLELVQRDSVFLLISRAHVVDFEALTELVLAGKFRAAIDVFPEEPLALDHRIRQAEGAILSAHRAGSVPEGLWEIGSMVLDDLESLAMGMPPRSLQPAMSELIPKYTKLSARRGQR